MATIFGMKNKGVSFNLDDPHQKKLFEWANQQTNFSNYVKRLIDYDMQKEGK